MRTILGRGIFQKLLDFIFPRKCLGCSRAHFLLCTDCRAKLPILQVQRCPVCEKVETPLGGVCTGCLHTVGITSRWALDGLWILSPYSPSSTLARLIKSLKYRSMEALAEILGQLLADRFPAHEFKTSLAIDPQTTVLVPIPLHPHRERKRGYNQALFLAQALEARYGFSLAEIVVRHRNTVPHAFSLSKKYREQGMIFFVPKKIILVDDVCSTGATLNKTAKVLKSAGATTVWGVVLARG